uniref:Ribonuclease M5 C-terminal domain-containing protein n=1 Tax=Auxenochlorella protothecoides TaxID=3075 RepID=A0A1D1ZNI4_AUXPR
MRWRSCWRSHGTRSSPSATAPLSLPRREPGALWVVSCREDVRWPCGARVVRPRRPPRGRLPVPHDDNMTECFAPHAPLRSRCHEVGNVGVEHASPEALRLALAAARPSSPERTAFTRERLEALGLVASGIGPAAGARAEVGRWINSNRNPPTAGLWSAGTLPFRPL